MQCRNDSVGRVGVAVRFDLGVMAYRRVWPVCPDLSKGFQRAGLGSRGTGMVSRSDSDATSCCGTRRRARKA